MVACLCFENVCDRNILRKGSQKSVQRNIIEKLTVELRKSMFVVTIIFIIDTTILGIFTQRKVVVLGIIKKIIKNVIRKSLRDLGVDQ